VTDQPKAGVSEPKPTKTPNRRAATKNTKKQASSPKSPARAQSSSRQSVTRLSKAQIDEMFRRFQEALPEPKSELHYYSPFTLLVAVVLSAQATDAGVNKATPALFKLADTPEKLLKLGLPKVTELVKTIGLYRSKAKNLIGLAQRLVDDFGSQVPEDREALESLPGVGRKTANVVLNVAFGEPVIAVDTHIFRVSNRTGLAPGKTPLEVEHGLDQVVPDKYKLHAHHWLILHGRYVCKARKPECYRCLISDICLFEPKTPPLG